MSIEERDLDGWQEQRKKTLLADSAKRTGQELRIPGMVLSYIVFIAFAIAMAVIAWEFAVKIWGSLLAADPG